MSAVLKDLIAGKKKFVKCDEVKVCFAPQYDGLSLECLFEQAAKYAELAEYLPDPRDQHRLPRQWVKNLMHTCLGTEFQDWVDAQVEKRNTKLA